MGGGGDTPTAPRPPAVRVLFPFGLAGGEGVIPITTTGGGEGTSSLALEPELQRDGNKEGDWLPSSQRSIGHQVLWEGFIYR